MSLFGYLLGCMGQLGEGREGFWAELGAIEELWDDMWCVRGILT